MKAYVFPGQGSQYKGMGKGLFEQYGDMVQQADTVLGYSIAELCLDDPERKLGFTEYTQPALYVVNALSYQEEIKKTKHLPGCLAGHSLGEYNALQASGAISFKDGLKMVKKRGELMSQAPKGAMAAILGSTENEIEWLLKNNDLSTVDVANYNLHDQTVISGLEEDIARAQSIFSEGNIKFIPLNANGAFHSHYMKPAATEFKKYIHQFTFSPLAIDVISNVQAKPYTQEKIKENLVDQITHSVKWSESIRHMMKLGVTEFKELGAGHVLTTLIEKIQAHTRTADKVIDTAIDIESTEVNLSSDNKPAIEDAKKTVTAWNNDWPVGTSVSCKNHGEILKTRTQAILLFDRKATIYMQGYKGYFDLADVQPVSEKKMSVDS